MNLDFMDRVIELQPSNQSDHYHDGFYEARDGAHDIVCDAALYIAKLEYYIRKMVGGDILEEIKMEMGE